MHWVSAVSLCRTGLAKPHRDFETSSKKSERPRLNISYLIKFKSPGLPGGLILDWQPGKFALGCSRKPSDNSRPRSGSNREFPWKARRPDSKSCRSGQPLPCASNDVWQNTHELYSCKYLNKRPLFALKVGEAEPVDPLVALPADFIKPEDFTESTRGRLILVLSSFALYANAVGLGAPPCAISLAWHEPKLVVFMRHRRVARQITAILTFGRGLIFFVH